MDKIACYIEEYTNNDNKLCARLRDKKTNKKVVILTNDDSKWHLLRFLSAAKRNVDIMPTVFDQNGNDIVAVYGRKKKENKATIFIDIANEGGYLFE